MGQYSALKTALKALIGGIDGSPSYTIDLSASDAVSQERFSRDSSALIPRAYLTPGSPAVQYRSRTDYNDLGSFGSVASFDLAIVVEPADGSNGARVLAAELAMDDLIKALGSNQDLSGTALSVEASLDVIQGSELGSSDYGIVFGTITALFLEVF